MTCAPFRVERSQVRLPKFASRRLCRELLPTDHPDCCCRSYPRRGYYVMGDCGHAHGWDLKREDADAQCERLNERAAKSAAADEGAPTGEAAPPAPSVEEQAAAAAEARALGQGWIP